MTDENRFPYQVMEDPGAQIHRAILAVIREIPAVDRNGTLELGGNKIPFQKVDEIRDAMNPILARHGIVSYIRVEDVKHELQVAQEPMTMVQFDADKNLLPGREIRDGKIPTTRSWAQAQVVMTYVFVGDNSEVTTRAFGLAYDTNSDKALSKATTQAVKRILIETFKITDHKELDDDSTTEDQGNRAATTDRREGGDRGQQARTAAQREAGAGTTRRTSEAVAKSTAENVKAVRDQKVADAIAETGANPATGEVPDERPEPQAPPEPSKLDAAKARVRETVGALKARDGDDAWPPARVDAIATELTGKATRAEWINGVTFVTKVANALEAELKKDGE
jgi:hypothetical protein